MRLPKGIEILRCVILGRLLVEHVDKSHSPCVNLKLVFSLISTHSLSLFLVLLVSRSYYPLCNNLSDFSDLRCARYLCASGVPIGT